MKESPYDRKLLIKYLLFIVITSVSMMATKGASAVLAPLFAFFFLAGGKEESLLYFLMVLLTATMGNDYFFPKGMTFGLSVRGTLIILALIMTTRIAGQKGSKFVTPLLMMVVYILYMILPSATGFQPVISYLKMVLFLSVFLAYYGAANALCNKPRIDAAKIRSCVLSFAILFIIGSFLIKPFTGISYLNARQIIDSGATYSLYKGMTMHSQSLGPVVAMYASLIFADLVFGVKKFDKLYILLLLLSPVLLYWTSSRTATGSYLAGHAFIMWAFGRSHFVGSRWKSRINTMVWSIVMVGSLIGATLPSIRNEVKRFIVKSAESADNTVTFERVTSSRQGLVDESMYNFRQKPVFGNGFQVSRAVANMELKGFSSYMSAPIEKGVWVSAVLEEGGVIGFSIFCLFVIVSLTLFTRRHAYVTAAMLIVSLVSNLGEFTIFSMSYTGGMVWTLIFAATVMDAQRVRQENFLRQQMAMMNWRRMY